MLRSSAHMAEDSKFGVIETRSSANASRTETLHLSLV